VRLMGGAMRDVRLALRQMRKAPAFYLTAILTLALGMGATIAIFSLVEGILLRPLPFADPDRLVIVGDHLGDGSNPGVTAREIATYQHATTAFSAMGGFAGAGYELSAGGAPELIVGARLGAGAFQALAVTPELGRIFTQKEDDAREPVAVISDALWLNRYHRDPRVLGRSIELNRKAYSIIGVMPRSFEFPLLPGRMNQAQVWVPLSLTADELSDKNAGAWAYRMVARLKDGVTQQQAAEDANRVSQQIMRDFPASMAAIHIRGDALSLREQTVAATRPLLRALLIAVLVMLAIACANVAAGVRAATGAGRASQCDPAPVGAGRPDSRRNGRRSRTGSGYGRGAGGAPSAAGFAAARGCNLNRSRGHGFCPRAGGGHGSPVQHGARLCRDARRHD
jgi:putative ABC transport system permease protein